MVAPAADKTDRVPPKWREHFQALVNARNRLTDRRGMLVREASEESPAYSLHIADAGTTGAVKRPRLGQLADLPKTSEPDREEESEEE